MKMCMSKFDRSSSPNCEVLCLWAWTQTAVSRCRVVPLHSIACVIDCAAYRHIPAGNERQTHIKCNIYTDNCRSALLLPLLFSNANTIWKPFLLFIYLFASLLSLVTHYYSLVRLCLPLYYYFFLLLSMSAWLIGFVASTCCCFNTLRLCADKCVYFQPFHHTQHTKVCARFLVLTNCN